MDSVTPLVALGAIVYTFTNFLKYLANRDKSAVVTQLEVWIAGIAGVFLFGASQIGGFVVPGTDIILSDMDGWTKLIVGLGAGSIPSVGYDFKRAVDNRDSAVTPSLLPGSNPPRVENNITTGVIGGPPR